MVQQKKNSGETVNGINKREYSNMSFQKKDVSDARVMGANSGKSDVKQNGTTAGSRNDFRTDSAISNSRLGRERPLQPWVGPTSSDGLDLNLEKSSGGGAWDQFAANERQFGIKSTYDESIYTTTIDKNHPQYKERMAAAEKKAREIERSAASTAHVAEERVMDYAGGDDAGGDEEDKYSGVKRQDFPPLPNSRENKYTPPARRAPTGSSTVKGAPVDPAIISSQLKTQKNQAAIPKQDDSKARPLKTEAPSAAPAVKSPETKTDSKAESQQKPPETKAANQNAAPLKPSAATSRTISPQAKDGQGVAPSATLTVELDVLKEFKSFANQQRANAEKARSTKAKADKEVKLIELKKFADSFKLPTPVPVDLISIIAKDPAKQREIQEKAKRDAAEVARRKAEEAAAKEKKGTAAKEAQANAASQPSDSRSGRPAANATAAIPTSAPSRHQGNRQSYAPPAYPYQGNRSGLQHMQQTGRQGGLGGRIRALDAQKAQGQDVRLPPTGPANTTDPSFARRMGGVPGHMGGKLNPNSHEFRPSPFAQTFSPNGHPSAGSSPRSAINHATEMQAGTVNTHSQLIVVTKKRKAVDAKKCVILSFVRTIQPPENKNWNDNDGLRPSYDTPPTWRSATDDEKPDSTMRLSYDEYFERQPFNTQPTPNPPHLLPQMAHQHQLPLHMQHGAHPAAPRHSPHVPPVQMHGGQHGPVPHAPFNGADEHRMMHSNSSQSYSSPRMGQISMVYPPNMNAAQIPYSQHMMPSFMGPGAPPMNQFNRSFSNTPQYVPQQPGGMGAPMMMQPQFMSPQPMVAGPPQMQPYPTGHLQFMPPGATPPQPMPGTNGYPSPGRPAAPLMVHQTSQQGQSMYTVSPGMPYQQPNFIPQQQGQMNNMRGYSNPGPQQFGTSPQQIHQYGPPHRNGSNNFKNYQGHSQHQGPQVGHAVQAGPQGRSSDGPDEAK
ncbi:poly(A)-binding protein binding protein [Parahypoxylon ruwenzoriense]